jgi:hypothetical protein
VTAAIGTEPELFFYDFFDSPTGFAVAGNTYFMSMASHGAVVKASSATFQTPSGYSSTLLLTGLDNPGDICGVKDGKLWLLTGSGTTSYGGRTKLSTLDLSNRSVVHVVTGLTGALSCSFDARGNGDVFIGDESNVYRLPATTSLPTNQGSLIWLGGGPGGAYLVSVAGYTKDTTTTFYFVQSGFEQSSGERATRMPLCQCCFQVAIMQMHALSSLLPHHYPPSHTCASAPTARTFPDHPSPVQHTGTNLFSFDIVRKTEPGSYQSFFSGSMDLGGAITVENSDASWPYAGTFYGPSIALDEANDALYVTYDPDNFNGAGPILFMPNASTRGGGTDGARFGAQLTQFPARLQVVDGKLYALGDATIYRTTCPLESTIPG